MPRGRAEKDECLPVATYPEGLRLSRLMEVVDERYEKSVTFHNGSSTGMDLGDVLAIRSPRTRYVSRAVWCWVGLER
ncbi:hypothetical protein HZ994_02540 [Akkermansiaceae bacterium]|nr:hypothetical protein HZ994_02540 [Akkermansiaceae bacterium]